MPFTRPPSLSAITLVAVMAITAVGVALAGRGIAGRVIALETGVPAESSAHMAPPRKGRRGSAVVAATGPHARPVTGTPAAGPAAPAR